MPEQSPGFGISPVVHLLRYVAEQREQLAPQRFPLILEIVGAQHPVEVVAIGNPLEFVGNLLVVGQAVEVRRHAPGQRTGDDHN